MTAAESPEHVHRWSDWSLHSHRHKPMWAKWLRGCMECPVRQQTAVISPPEDQA